MVCSTCKKDKHEMLARYSRVFELKICEIKGYFELNFRL